jgi:nitroreductase
MQPWRVHALAGEALARFTEAVQSAFLAGAEEPREYEYYPSPFFEPYLSRRREIGWNLYSLLGIGRRETEKMQAQHARNFTFFDAPVGLICTIHRGLKIGSWLDFGMFLENIMVAARGRGLDTCPQAAFSQYSHTIRSTLDLREDEVVVCGMAIGHADPDAPENALRTSRVPASEFASFAGFGE